MDKQTVSNDLQEQWSKVCGALRAEVGEAAFQSWLKPISVRDQMDGEVRLSVPTRFMRDWVIAHYADRLAELWEAEDAAVSAIRVTVQSDLKPPISQGRVPNRPVKTIAKTDGPKTNPAPFQASRHGGNAMTGFSRRRSDRGMDSDIGAPLDQRFTFDQFVVGKPNEFAYAAARRVAEAEQVHFNPLFLYGGVGLGKTHLMHAIAWHVRKVNPERTVIYMSAEKFMYRFVRALRDKNTVDFKEQFRSVDVLMIDDVQFISGKDSTQEEFFHTFNALVDQGRQIVISADKSPVDLQGIEDRLKSRLNCGLVADIHNTSYELRLGILQSKAQALGTEVPRKVLEFLAHKITANVRELEGSLNRVVAHSQLVGRDITLEGTQEVLHDLLRVSDRRVTIEEIQKQVSAHFNIKVSEMSSHRRARSVARPRQVAMYLAKQLTSRSLPEIGRKFERDHTTVMHAVKKVEELREHDAGFAEDVDLLRRMLEA